MSDLNEMRLGRFGKSGDVNLDKIKAGLTEEEARKISGKAANIFNAYDANHNHVLDEAEAQAILADVRQYAKHGKNTIFSQKEAQKLIRNNNIVGADADAYFDLLSGIEGKAIEADNAPEPQNTPPAQTQDTPPVQQQNTPPAQQQNQSVQQQNTPPAQQQNQSVQQQNTPPAQQQNTPVQQNTPTQQNTPAQNNNQKKGNVTYALSGESFDDTAKRLGFAKGTPEYEAFVQANKKASGRKWFMVGEEVHIPDALLGKLKDGAILSKEQGLAEVEKWKKKVGKGGGKTGGAGSSSAHGAAGVTPSVTPTTPRVATTKPKKKKPVSGAGNVHKPSGAGNTGRAGNTHKPSGVNGPKKAAPAKPVKKPDNKGAKPAAKPVQKSQDYNDQIAWLKRTKHQYTVTGNEKVGYTVTVTGGPNMDKWHCYNKVMKFDKNGAFVSEINKFDNGAITQRTRTNGKDTTKNTQNAAPKRQQDLQAKLQKAAKGKAHLEYDGRSKKWSCVQTGVSVKGVKVKEIRTVLNNDCWQKGMSEDAKKKYVESNMSTMKKVSTFLSKVGFGTDYEQIYKDRTNPDKAKDEDFYASQQITFEDGRITNATYQQGEQARLVNVKEGPKKDEKEKQKINTPTKISFNIPKNAPQTEKKFAGKLSNMDTKAGLMKDLHLDSDTYNTLAKTAFGIAAHEMDGTSWGEKPSNRLYMKLGLQDADTNGDGIIDDKDEIDYSKQAKRLANGESKIRIAAATAASKEMKGHHISYGITQLKYATFVNSSDPKTAKFYKDMFAKYGIHSAKDLNDPEKSAVATMIVLSQLNNQVNSKEIQAGIKKCQGTVVHMQGYKYDEKTRTLNKTSDGSSEMFVNEVTTEDALCLLWNKGHANDIINGTFQPAVWSYSNDVRRQINASNFEETAEARKEAIEADEQKKNFKGKGMSGDQGSVVFMPAMYADKDKHLNTKAERDKLTQKLTAKGIDKNYITQLTTAMANGEVAFDFGLRDSEIDSMTNGDIKLLLLHLNKLKKTVNQDPKKVNTSDGINKNEAKELQTHYSQQIFNAEDDYRRSYLTNHHSTSYQINKVGAEHVLDGQAKGVDAPTYFDGTSRNRRGYAHVKSKGVNVNTTTGQISEVQKTLATEAHNYVQRSNPKNNNSGNCLTGVKAAMHNAGIDISDMTKYGSTPRHVNNWFLRSKYFTRVSYVKTSSDRSREIVESDLRSLPAGYVVVFVPEEGSKYESQAGHISVTNGYGQGLSDSSDNLGWSNYESSRNGSGKGEHGTFYVYKLSDKCYMDNGKIKLKQ